MNSMNDFAMQLNDSPVLASFSLILIFRPHGAKVIIDKYTGSYY